MREFAFGWTKIVRGPMRVQCACACVRACACSCVFDRLLVCVAYLFVGEQLFLQLLSFGQRLLTFTTNKLPHDCVLLRSFHVCPFTGTAILRLQLGSVQFASMIPVRMKYIKTTQNGKFWAARYDVCGGGIVFLVCFFIFVLVGIEFHRWRFVHWILMGAGTPTHNRKKIEQNCRIIYSKWVSINGKIGEQSHAAQPYYRLTFTRISNGNWSQIARFTMIFSKSANSSRNKWAAYVSVCLSVCVTKVTRSQLKRPH